MKITTMLKTTIDALNYGDVFSYYDRYMIKTKQRDIDGAFICIDIKTGDYTYMRPDVTISQVNAEVIIK